MSVEQHTLSGKAEEVNIFLVALLNFTVTIPWQGNNVKGKQSRSSGGASDLPRIALGRGCPFLAHFARSEDSRHEPGWRVATAIPPLPRRKPFYDRPADVEHVWSGRPARCL